MAKKPQEVGKGVVLNIVSFQKKKKKKKTFLKK